MRHAALALLLCAAACGEEQAPKGRVLALSAPENADDARRAGCFSSGARAGSGFGDLLRAHGGLEQYLELRDGHIKVVMIAEAYAWDGRNSRFTLRFLPGEDRGDGAVGLSEDMYKLHNMYGDAPSEFPETAIDGENWVDLYTDRFHFPRVALFDDYPFELVLEATNFAGKVYGDELGLTASGVLSGYLTHARISAEAAKFSSACEHGTSPLACARAKEAFGEAITPELVEDALLGIAGGMDAETCGANACEAVSVCFVLDAEAIDP